MPTWRTSASFSSGSRPARRGRTASTLAANGTATRRTSRSSGAPTATRSRIGGGARFGGWRFRRLAARGRVLSHGAMTAAASPLEHVASHASSNVFVTPFCTRSSHLRRRSSSCSSRTSPSGSPRRSTRSSSPPWCTGGHNSLCTGGTSGYRFSNNS